jgi:hypothetical protein
LRVLDNDNENVTIQNGQVVLNLVPIFNNVLQEVEQRASGILGRNVNLPEITPGMLPDTARQKIEKAIGRPLPENWGTVVVFKAHELTALQRSVEVFKRATALLAIAAVLLIALTIWVSPRRRRTILQLALGIGLVTVVLRRVVFTAQGEILGQIKIQQNEKAVSNILDQVLGGYLGLTVAVLWLCAFVALVAFLVGPARPAVAVRNGAVSLWHATTGAVSKTSERAASIGWVQEHREALQVGVGIVAVLYLLIADVSWWRLLITAIVVGVLELVLARAAPSEPQSPPAGDASAA